MVPLTATTGSHALLLRRSIADPSEVALFLVFTTRATTLAEIVPAAGQRWQIEAGFETAKGEVGLDHYLIIMRSASGWPGIGMSPWPCWLMLASP